MTRAKKIKEKEETRDKNFSIFFYLEAHAKKLVRQEEQETDAK